ncbi:unnamed protein product [Absidia cylindrospora]
MNTSPIVSTLVNYARILQEAQSPRAALWQSNFIDQINKYVSQDLYRYLLSTYTFLDGNATARENLTMDLTRLAGMVATHNVLDEMEKLLVEEVNNDDTGQNG